jgi:chromosome segregation ATPase
VFNDLDELPSFADEECQELCRQIRLMDIEKDEVAKHSKEHTERVSSMRDHLQNVRQEIVYTNGLHAAKQKEIDTEKHLIALADREMVAITTEVKVANESIQKEKKTINTLQGQINVANEELETLKMSLNWNQEELEQWATAAAKKESDNQALEKYRRADEVKIKELLLKLENLTKMSVTKSAEIENEKTETQSKQLEVDRITKLFKQNHEERRQLIQQWQKSIEVMKDRDAEIDKVSVKYREASEEVESQITDISKRRKEIFYIKVR